MILKEKETMAIGKSKRPAAQAAPQAKPIQKADRYLSMAVSELDRANKAGRLEAQTVHTMRACAAAQLATIFRDVALTDLQMQNRQSSATPSLHPHHRRPGQGKSQQCRALDTPHGRQYPPLRRGVAR